MAFVSAKFRHLFLHGIIGKMITKMNEATKIKSKIPGPIKKLIRQKKTIEKLLHLVI